MSVGGDTDGMTNPFEVRLGKYVDLDVGDDVVGIAALQRISAEGIRRHQLGLGLEGEAPAPLGFRRENITQDGQRIGMMTNCVWSPRMQANIGYALIDASVPAGEVVHVLRDQGVVAGRLVDLTFL